jgi:CheY-like chemotaxis protein
MKRTNEEQRPATILVVDDEPEVCGLIRRILRQDDFRVLYATSGQRALARLRRRVVDAKTRGGKSRNKLRLTTKQQSQEAPQRTRRARSRLLLALRDLRGEKD